MSGHRGLAYKGIKTSGKATSASGKFLRNFTDKYAMDCVGFVSFAVHNSLKIGGQSFTYYITPTRYPNNCKNGFIKVTDGIKKPGDILANDHHVAVYAGKDKVVDSNNSGPAGGITHRIINKDEFTSIYRISDTTAAGISKDNTTVQFNGLGSTTYDFSQSEQNVETMILSGTPPEHISSGCKDFPGYFSWTNVSYSSEINTEQSGDTQNPIETNYDNSSVPSKVLQGSKQDMFNWLFDGNGNMAYNTTEAAIMKYQVTIDVPVINEKGKSTTKKLTVHKKVAGDIVKIFTEIKAGGFKIRNYDTGAYNWRGGQKIGSGLYSMHCLGLAVDVNWDSNYAIRINTGKVEGGKWWKPGVDEFSMPADGIAVKAFKKYGWKWGGDWKTYKDYMHFSLTGN